MQLCSAKFYIRPCRSLDKKYCKLMHWIDGTTFINKRIETFLKLKRWNDITLKLKTSINFVQYKVFIIYRRHTWFFIYISYYLNKTPSICPGTLQRWQTRHRVQHHHHHHHHHHIITNITVIPNVIMCIMVISLFYDRRKLRENLRRRHWNESHKTGNFIYLLSDY